MIGERQRMLTSHQLTSILETFVSWLEPCDESYIKELKLLGVTDEADQDLKRKGGKHDSVPLKKSKL